MTDEDRALAGIHRRRASSEPAADAFDSDDDRFTPVSSIIERAADLTDRERNLLRYIWAHTANMEMRARARSDSQDGALLARRIDELESSVVDISGKSGNNGKLGALKERVDKTEARRWWVITFLAGLLVTVIGSAIALGSWMGSIETTVETLQVRSLRARAGNTPEYPATKEGNTP